MYQEILRRNSYMEILLSSGFLNEAQAWGCQIKYRMPVQPKFHRNNNLLAQQCPKPCMGYTTELFSVYLKFKLNWVSWIFICLIWQHNQATNQTRILEHRRSTPGQLVSHWAAESASSGVDTVFKTWIHLCSVVCLIILPIVLSPFKTGYLLWTPT